MVKITDKYYLDSDNLQFIVVERKVVSDKNSKNYGKEMFTNVAYCGRIEQVATWLFDQMIIEDLEMIKNIQSIVEIKNELVEKLSEARR